jgi:hypothetical protein
MGTDLEYELRQLPVMKGKNAAKEYVPINPGEIHSVDW